MPKIPVEVEFTAKDNHATGVMDTMARGAERLSHSVNHVSEQLATVLGIAGGLGISFGLEHLIAETNEHVLAVSKLAAVTGLTTERADGLGEAFALVGLSADETTTVLSRMSLQSLKMEDAMMGIAGPGGGAAMMQRTFAHLGVDLRHGVVPAMTQMAKRAQDGKLSAMDLRLALRGLPVEAAIKMQRMLARGPADLKHTMDEIIEGGLAVTKQDERAMFQMKRAGNEMKAAAERITLVFGREIMPVVTALMHDVAEGVKGWVEPAKAFGKFLGAYLREGISLAATLGKILLANYTLQRAGFGGIGGVGSKAFGMIKGAATAGGVGAWTASGGSGLATLAGVAAGGAASIGLLGLAAGTAAAGLEAMAKNTDDVRSFVFSGFDELLSSLSNLFGGIFDDISSSDLWDMLGHVLPLALHGLADVIGFLTTGTQKLATFIAIMIDAIGDFFERGRFGGWRSIGEMWGAASAQIDKEIAARTAARAAAREAAGSRANEGKTETNQHFYNARFDITQKFEEGFDPDRILTAFANDLAALGERGIQSGFQPAYTSSLAKG